MTSETPYIFNPATTLGLLTAYSFQDSEENAPDYQGRSVNKKETGLYLHKLSE